MHTFLGPNGAFWSIDYTITVNLIIWVLDSNRVPS